ncbi:MAG: tetratricopeptide repeat protein, partial [Chloroflexota bacterium]
MSDRFLLADTLNDLVSRRGYTIGQLARLSDVPKRTIANWLEGRVRRPRVCYDLLKIARVLRLEIDEVSSLIEAAGHPPLSELVHLANRDEDDKLQEVLSYWLEPLPPKEPHPLAEPTANLIPATIPSVTPFFTGRHQDLNTLMKAILDGQSTNIMALQGMGGIGKTTLALQLAHELEDYFTGGIFWGNLPAFDGNIRPILRFWAQLCAYDLTDEVGVSSLVHIVRGLLRQRLELQGPLCVIIDDVRFEWLENVKILQRALPLNTLLLLTTRDESLALALNATLHRLDILAEDESLSLLKMHAGEEIVEREPESASALLRLVGYLPLALELAGKRLALLARKPGYRLATLRDEVECRANIALKFSGYKGLSATFSMTYDGLSEEAQRTFRWLGIFASGETSIVTIADILTRNLDDIELVLDELVWASLVQYGKEAGIFSLHPLLRQYAQHLLFEAGDISDARRCHWIHYLAICHRNADPTPDKHNQLEAALPDILQAINAVSQEGDYTTLLEFGDAIFQHSNVLMIRGYLQSAYDVLPLVIEASQDLSDFTRQSIFLRNLGVVCFKLGRIEEAQNHFQQALAIARVNQLQSEEGMILRSLGEIYLNQGQYDEAINLFDTGLRLARKTEDKSLQAELLDGLGNIYNKLGRNEESRDCLQQALNLAQEIKDQHLESKYWGNLGHALRDLGNIQTSVKYYQQSLVLAQQLGNRALEGYRLGDLGKSFRIFGQLDEAADYLRQALQIFQKIGDRKGEGYLSLNLGRIYYERGDFEQTANYYHQALNVIEDAGLF